MFGKWHQIPQNEITPVGPFTHWPTREGFDTFYGIIGGADDQFHPNLHSGTTQVEPPSTPDEGYQRRRPHTVAPRHRRGTDDPGGRRDPAPGPGRRNRSAPRRGHLDAVCAARRRRARPAPHPALRDLRNRGIYHEGWTAVTKHRSPWELSRTEPIPFDEDTWELYDITRDFSQATDLASVHPQRLAALGIGRGWTGRILVDGQVVGEGRVERTALFGSGRLTVGANPGTPVTSDYARGGEYRYTGRVGEVTHETEAARSRPTGAQRLEAELVTH